MNKEAILNILKTNNLELLQKKAYSVMKKYCGEMVYYRGLLEFSNYCDNDCYYCGIRKSNKKLKRFFLRKEEIIDIAEWCAKNGYASIVLQSGEIRNKNFIDFVEDIVRTIKEKTKSKKLPNGLGITLCV